MADDRDPVVVLDPQTRAERPAHVELVVAVDLPQPRILRAPGVVHGHRPLGDGAQRIGGAVDRSEEPTSELQSLMRISYAVFCLQKKKKNNKTYYKQQ